MLLFSLPRPQDSSAQFPPRADTWNKPTNHVRVSSTIIIVRESIEGTLPDLVWLVKFPLDHAQHLSVAGLEAHLPCQGTGEKNVSSLT